MSLAITVHYVSTSKSSIYDTLLESYRKKIAPFASLNELRIKGEGDDERAVTLEAEKIFSKWPSTGKTVALSRDGRLIDNQAWFRAVQSWMETPPAQVHFFIGGARGLHDDILDKSDEVISLSPLTFAHHLGRLILYEQLFRALTVRHGIKYHKTADRKVVSRSYPGEGRAHGQKKKRKI